MSTSLCARAFRRSLSSTQIFSQNHHHAMVACGILSERKAVTKTSLQPLLLSTTKAIHHRLYCSVDTNIANSDCAKVACKERKMEDLLKGFKYIEATLVEEESVGLIVLNRPEVLNALSEALMHEMIDALKIFDEMSKVGAIVITGKGKAFAAGADIKEMKDKELIDIYTSSFPSKWTDMARINKPIIAAVNGYALGGGCEMALMCDIVLAGESAIFGQPEINLGTIPGIGGTQRLIREIGKSRAMEMILTGKFFIDAQEACQRGLASRVIGGGSEKLLTAALDVAKRISQQSRPAVIMAKAAVNAAYEVGLQEGIKREQNLFAATFGLKDQKEGMSAFIEKRKPQFQHK